MAGFGQPSVQLHPGHLVPDCRCHGQIPGQAAHPQGLPSTGRPSGFLHRGQNGGNQPTRNIRASLTLCQQLRTQTGRLTNSIFFLVITFNDIWRISFKIVSKYLSEMEVGSLAHKGS